MEIREPIKRFIDKYFNWLALVFTVLLIGGFFASNTLSDMKLYGLIGYPLGHSFSQRYFTDKFAAAGIADCAYRIFRSNDRRRRNRIANARPARIQCHDSV